MFFLRYLEREINIHPSFFGNNVHDRLKDQLYADMEGSCNGEYYVVCIMDIYNISPGKVTPGSGEATFVILYRAILWKPFKGETVGRGSPTFCLQDPRLTDFPRFPDRLHGYWSQAPRSLLRGRSFDCLCFSNGIWLRC
jgi:hypothetical protein